MLEIIFLWDYLLGEVMFVFVFFAGNGLIALTTLFPYKRLLHQLVIVCFFIDLIIVFFNALYFPPLNYEMFFSLGNFTQEQDKMEGPYAALVHYTIICLFEQFAIYICLRDAISNDFPLKLFIGIHIPLVFSMGFMFTPIYMMFRKCFYGAFTPQLVPEIKSKVA